MGFHIGPNFHVSSDFQIPRFRVPLRAAEWFFILVLIFIYLQISRIREFLGTQNAAKRRFILVLIFMYLQISRISQFRGRLNAAEQFFFFVLIFMFLQNSRIRGFRVALRAAEWFFISVHVFDVFLDQQDSWIQSLKVIKVKVNFYQMSFLYIQFSEIEILGISISQFCLSRKFDVYVL